MRNLIARLVAFWRGRLIAPAPELPAWAQAGRRRRAHIRRVVGVLEEWAQEMGVSERERQRWIRAAWLHDALRDARLAKGTNHGAAAADRAAKDGESDAGVLDAVRYHSIGYAGWDQVGRMLFLADYLEPGRGRGRKRRAKLLKRVPRDPDRVLQEVVAQQMRERLKSRRPVNPLTLEFWNSVVSR